MPEDCSRRSFLQYGAAAVTGSVMLRPVGARQATPLAAHQDFELEEATVAQLQDAMRTGARTARSICVAYLARIAELNPKLHAVLETNPDALAIADRLDAERKAGHTRGPLHGIPVLIKDNIATADKMMTTAGSLALVGVPVPRDAALVARLRAAGAVIIGKTNLSEWANIRSNHSISGWSGRGGQCRNPYALDRNPCGSSSGTGAAIAASFAAVGVGTETDGSIVCPSGANSLVGLKPTVGLVSRSGVIPISHSYGFSNLLTPLIARGVPMVISCDRTPRAIFADLARSNATVFPGMPVFYHAFCEMEHVPVLPKLRLCISAGAPLSIAIAKKFQEKFKLAIHSFYGASECGGICYDREAINQSEGFVGEPMKGIEVKVIDPKALLSRIQVRSAAVGDGYFPDRDEETLGNGIFVLDDLLVRDGSGFKIVGRISDVINVAGKKVNPAEVEAHLLRFTGVRQVIVFGRPAGAALRNEDVMACVAASPQLSEADLLQFCRDALSPWQVPKRIFVVDAIPTNERGKISRRELACHFGRL